MDVFEFIGRCVVYGGLFTACLTVIAIVTGCLIFGGNSDDENEGE